MTVVQRTASGAGKKTVEVIKRDEIVVRFAGDSGDGMQLVGTQFTNTSAIFGNDICTLPDYPAEIRAPAGSLAGVSGFQVSFSSHDVRTPGDAVNCLVAMNPAGLKTNLPDLEDGGVLVVNEDAFTKVNLEKAGYAENPLEDGSLRKYQLYRVPLGKLTAEANKDSSLTARALGRCKNFTALGVVYWLYGRSPETTLRWIRDKFGTKPAVADANVAALNRGMYFGETAEMFAVRYQVDKARIAPGRYRKVTGNEAIAMGLVTAAHQAEKTLFYGSYPITPASDILHELSRLKRFGVRTFQAEDEIAAVTACCGAAFAGALAATGTSGPGVALKSEALGLAVMTELPMVVVNVQRGGPSTGLPTKTEQADLFQALYGRNGECPLPVLAPATPGDCFRIALEAARIAMRYMVPVMVLSDGYLANGAEPWAIPDVASLPSLKIEHPTVGDNGYHPYARDARLSRPWALPGTSGLEHRIGGLEKEDVSGNVCYDPDNHQRMVDIRAKKVADIVREIPPLEVLGDRSGRLLVVGWGSTYGAITTAVEHCRASGMDVSSIHLRYLNPLPPDLGDILKGFEQVVCPEMNNGQLRHHLRGVYATEVLGLNKVTGKPFQIHEITAKIESLLNGETK